MSGLRDLLIRCPTVYASLEADLQRGSAGGESERVSGGGGDEKPAPVQLAVADHRHALLRGLRYWVAITSQHPEVPQPFGVAESPVKMCAWLLGNYHLLSVAHQTEMASNLSDWVHGSSGMGDLPKIRSSVPLGVTCLNVTEVDDVVLYACGGTLWAMMPADRDASAWLTCRECRGRWDVTDLPAAANISVPVHEAAQMLGVHVRTIRRRATREGGMVKLGDVLRNGVAH
jgi:hypothetical protein